MVPGHGAHRYGIDQKPTSTSACIVSSSARRSSFFGTIYFIYFFGCRFEWTLDEFEPSEPSPSDRRCDASLDDDYNDDFGRSMRASDALSFCNNRRYPNKRILFRWKLFCDELTWIVCSVSLAPFGVGVNWIYIYSYCIFLKKAATESTVIPFTTLYFMYAVR